MKRFTKIVLLAFVFLYVPFVAYASYKDEGNDGLTEDDAYIIDSIEDFKELQTSVNSGFEPEGRYYKLKANLDLSDPYFKELESIGSTSSNPFRGHFNGDGKKITVKIYRKDPSYSYSGTSIFGYLEPGSGYAIKNLTVSGIIEGYNCVSGIAQVLVNGTISNCHFTGQVFAYDNYKSNISILSGGIVGRQNGGIIERCTVKKGSIYVQVNCENKLPYAGGIVAGMLGGIIQDCEVIEDSKIRTVRTTTQGRGCSGGIVGYANLKSNTDGIKKCIFKGDITSSTKYTNIVVYCGGIVGTMSGGSITACNILPESTISSTCTYPINSSYSSNTHSHVGGIAAEILSNGIIQECIVESGVNLLSQVAAGTKNNPALGGIVGVVDKGTVKSNCFYGELTGNATYVGGIIGKITDALTTISDNKYKNAKYGIGFDLNGFSSNEGCINVSSLTIKTASLAKGYTGKAYSKTLSASGAKTITWKIIEGNLPTGLTLSSSGKISGIPTKKGTFKFTVQASNNVGIATQELSIKIVQDITIATKTLANSFIDNSYFVTLTATGTGTITWSKTKGSLPTGLKLSKKGQIVGVPTKTGTFSFTVKAKNNYGSATKALKIVIKAGKPAVTTTSLPDGYMGSVYNVQLQASGTAPFTWTKSSGTLPSGIVLAKSGHLIGIPTKTGEFTVTFKVTNTLGSATKKLTLRIMAEEEEGEDTNTTSKAKTKDKDTSEENQSVENKSKVVTGEEIKFGAERTTASIPQSILNSISNDKKMIAAVLPEVTVNEYGLYVFEGVSLDSKVPEGWKLSWHSYPKSSEADENETVEFFDDEGETLSDVPENHNVNVSVGLDTGIYYPVIVAEAESESSNEDSSSGSSGCNVGFNSLLLLAGFWIMRRKK